MDEQVNRTLNPLHALTESAMRQCARALALLALVLLTPYLGLLVRSAASVEIDETTVVTRVIDGDTFDTLSGDRIRLADVDTPEKGESGYHEARNFTIKLLYLQSVFLDIDDVHKTDRYDRLVCVVFVDYNTTHFLNVNKALLDEGYATIWDFENEFNPYTWRRYYPKEEDSEPQLTETQGDFVVVAAMIAVVAVVGIIGILLYAKRKPRSKPRHRLIR
jgi:endonuclease YncB( thermonuclease family)